MAVNPCCFEMCLWAAWLEIYRIAGNFWIQNIRSSAIFRHFMVRGSLLLLVLQVKVVGFYSRQRAS